jgi:hypothetical protein
LSDSGGTSYNDIDHAWNSKCETDYFRHQAIASVGAYQDTISVDDEHGNSVLLICELSKPLCCGNSAS